MTTENGKKCRKCLLEELDAKKLAESIADHVSLIPEDKRTDAEEYSRRLGICKGCPSLMEGMCGECGCFVEIRAAKSHMRCPVCKW